MKAWGLLLAATVGWACNIVLNRVILARGVTTPDLVFLRTAIATMALLVVASVVPMFRSRSRTTWVRGAVLGVAMAVPAVLTTKALEDIPVSLGGILTTLFPISTAAAAHFVVEGERFNPKAVPGLLIALIGALLLVGVGGMSLEGLPHLWRGVAFCTAGVVCGGLSGALIKRFSADLAGSELLIPQFAACTAVLLVTATVVGGIKVNDLEGQDVFLITVQGLIGAALPFTAFTLAAASSPAWRLGLTGYTVPVAAVAIAVGFLGEHLTFSIMIGATLILAGVLWAERAGSRLRTPEPL